MNKMNVMVLFSILTIVGCLENKDLDLPMVSQEVIAKHMASLASDDFQGRMPCTKGEEKTVAYLEQEMMRIGLLPPSEAGYKQTVPLVDISGNMTTDMIVETKNEKFRLKQGVDFVVH